ncbi:MAG: hypothetical protein ACFBSD_00660 [Paracoccaceae bacterium]
MGPRPTAALAGLAMIATVLSPIEGSAQPGPIETVLAPRLSADADGAFVLARVEIAYPLVRATRLIPTAEAGDRPSDLRVTLLVLDNGPSRPGGPPSQRDLHLAVFNVIEEYGTAWAIEPLPVVWRFVGAERRAAGIYTVEADLPPPPGTDLDCPVAEALIAIDALSLAAEVRAAPGLGLGETRRYSAPVGITLERLACPG